MSETGSKPRKFSKLTGKGRHFGATNSNANGSMASISVQNEPLAVGKRRLHVTSCQEDSMEDDDDDDVSLPNDFKRHCFIEELCTCEIIDYQNSNSTKFATV